MLHTRVGETYLLLGIVPWPCRYSGPRLDTEDESSDEMVPSRRSWPHWGGMLGYDLTWHRYIYKTRLKRSLKICREEAGLRDRNPERVVTNLRFIETMDQPLVDEKARSACSLLHQSTRELDRLQKYGQT